MRGLNTTNTPWYILGTGTQYHTVQDHAKLKLAYDITPTVRASYTLGVAEHLGRALESYLKNAAGASVYSGPVNIDGHSYNISSTAFPLTNDAQTHVMHGLSVKSHTKGEWDWEVAASLYDYAKDQQRAATTELPLAATGGAGTLQDQDGTGWNTLAARGTWRPQAWVARTSSTSASAVTRTSWPSARPMSPGSWLDGASSTLVSDVGGHTRDRQPVAAGCVVLRAEMEGGARPALRGLARQRRHHVDSDQHAASMPTAHANPTFRRRPRWRTSSPAPLCSRLGRPVGALPDGR